MKVTVGFKQLRKDIQELNEYIKHQKDADFLPFQHLYFGDEEVASGEVDVGHMDGEAGIVVKIHGLFCVRIWDGQRQILHC